MLFFPPFLFVAGFLGFFSPLAQNSESLLVIESYQLQFTESIITVYDNKENIRTNTVSDL